MKRITLAFLVSAAALVAHSARASSNFSIGVRIGSPVVPVIVPAAPVVVAAPAPAYCPPPAPAYCPPPAAAYCPPPATVVYEPRGYWRDVAVKTWVPERWVMSRDNCGRLVRVCEPGYYAYRTERVWFDGRHDNGYRRGYDNRYGYENRYGWNR